MSYNVGDLIPIRDILLTELMKTEIEPSIRFYDTDNVLNNYTIDTAGEFELINGQPVLVNFVNTNTGSSTILIDNMISSKPILKNVGEAVSSGDLSGYMRLVYVSTLDAFIVQPIFTMLDKSALNTIANEAEYTHPATHPVSMITDAVSQTDLANALANLVNSAPTTLDTLNEIAAALGNDPNLATTLTNLIATKAQIKYINTTFLANTTTLVVNDAFVVENTCSVDVIPQSNKSGIWTVDYVNGVITITSDTSEPIAVSVKIEIRKAGL